MNATSIRIGRLLATAIVIASMAAVETDAQTADVAGDWTFTVTADLSGVTTPAVTLEQDGETLSGHYSSENLGEADLTGTVNGSEVTFSFMADLLGQLAEVVYSGNLDENGEMSGTVDIGGGFLTGTFTATRADG